MAKRRESSGIGDDEELSRLYARILGERLHDPRVSDVLRVCLRALPRRLPVGAGVRHDVAALIERVIRVGERGTFDIVGTPREIDAELANALGETVGDPRRTYRALRALLGHTVLVERRSRQSWILRLSGLSEPASALHRALIAETPSQYCLPHPAEPTPLVTAPTTPPEQVPVPELQRTLEQEQSRRIRAEQEATAARDEAAELRRALEAEQRRRSEAENLVEAARAEVARLTAQLAEMREDEDPEQPEDRPAETSPPPSRQEPAPAVQEPHARPETRRQLAAAVRGATGFLGLSEENAAKAMDQLDSLQSRIELFRDIPGLVGKPGKGSGRGGKSRDKRKRRRAR